VRAQRLFAPSVRPYGEPMRQPVVVDDVDAVCGRSNTPEELRAGAAQLATWAEEGRPEDEISPAALLVTAGGLLSRAGDHTAAVSTLRRALAAGGDVPPDVRCYLHRALLDLGDVEGARALADEVRREHPSDGDAYLFLATSYDRGDSAREAHRWATLGLLHMAARIEQGDEAAAGSAAALAQLRYRVRRKLGLPTDEYDSTVDRARRDAAGLTVPQGRTAPV
jgi:predicted Zn-dependent protease